MVVRKEAAINILRSTSIPPLDVAGARGQYLCTPRTSTGGLTHTDRAGASDIIGAIAPSKFRPDSSKISPRGQLFTLFAQRQRQMPVAAPVLQRRRRAVLAPEQHHRIAADGAAEQVVGQFMALGGDVPGVFDELFHATKALLPLSPKWPLLRVFLASIGLVGKSRKAVLPSRAPTVG